MPVIESLSTASDDPLISLIQLDMKTGVRILRATVFHAPSCLAGPGRALYGIERLRCAIAE